jgi:hypothetical protein
VATGRAKLSFQRIRYYGFWVCGERFLTCIIPGDFNFLSDQHVEGAGENQLRFQVRLDQARDFCGEHRPAVWLEGAKAVKVQDRRLMPRHGLLRVVGQINPLQGHSDPIGDVREVASEI